MGDQQLIGSTKDNGLFLLSNSREADLEKLEITYIWEAVHPDSE